MPLAAPASSKAQIDGDAILDAIRPALNAALFEIGERETESIIASLSVPVVRDAGGNVVERSKPGEPPRVDEDVLRQNVVFDVVYDEGVPVLTIEASRPPESAGDNADAAVILEEGGVSNFGPIEPRPFMAPAL